MAKLEITLQQDTPMWHFRPNEKGCCLRASEVKPKLDKFIIKKCKEVNITIGDNWKLKNQDKNSNGTHLDYKMSFEAIGERGIYCDAKNKNNFAPFFGNNCKQEDEQFFNFKGLIYYPHGVKMTIFSLYGDLVEVINKYICEFFACHSFGTRQSKGFGCFYPKEIKLNNQDIKVLPCPIIINAVAQYKFQTKEIKLNSFNDLFSYIDNFHKLIRSGINFRSYYKSLMYSYVKDELKKDWDKPQIRYQFKLFPYHKHKFDKQIKTNSNGITLYRDALGLSSTQIWGKDRNSRERIVNITGKDINRFKSPILYRPVYLNNKYEIYIFLNNETVKQIHNKEFCIEYNNETAKAIMSKFDLVNYFEFIKNNIKKADNTAKDDNENPINNPKIDEYIGQIKTSFTKL